MDDFEYNFVKYKIRSLTGIDLNGYKRPQMERRLSAYLQRAGYTNPTLYFRAIQNDRAAIEKLKNYLTIGVSQFFRDKERFDSLQEHILPELLKKHRMLRVWSAGCSRGHEPYSLLLALIGLTNLYHPHYILATDVDNDALTIARAGGPYPVDEMSNVSPEQLKQYFVADKDKDKYAIQPTLRHRIVFRQHNLLDDEFGNKFDLIVCRNVTIYFTREVKDRLYSRFYDSLRPGGVLFIGASELIPQKSLTGFEVVKFSFYRKTK